MDGLNLLKSVYVYSNLEGGGVFKGLPHYDKNYRLVFPFFLILFDDMSAGGNFTFSPMGKKLNYHPRIFYHRLLGTNNEITTNSFILL